jgi:uncharacterized protein (DUF1800 family)
LAVDPFLLSIRFGYGPGPARPLPRDPSDLLQPLAGPDQMAARFPVAPFAVIYDETRAYQIDMRLRNQLRREVRAMDAPPADLLERLDAASDAARWHIHEGRRRQARSLGAALARIAETDDPFRERLTRFWADHFTVIGKNGLTRWSASAYVEEALRPRLTGNFADLLIAAVTHPMMLLYLDQSNSIGPNSEAAANKAAQAAADPSRNNATAGGLNENLAREVMELHTLGVGARYGQEDVRQLAELFAGMMAILNKDGLTFQPARGEPGAETVLGRSYGGTRPAMDDITAVLRDLALHPDTARHLARKLAVHFVSDDPDPALIDALAARYLETGGELLPVYELLLHHPAALSPPLTKAKQPFDFMASSLRALGVPGARLAGLDRTAVQRHLIRPMTRMGQPWEVPTGPDGWSEPDVAWITPQGLAARIEWAMALHDHLEDNLGVTPPDPRRLVDTALGPDAHQAVVFAAGAAETRAEGIGIVLVSPQFQRR